MLKRLDRLSALIDRFRIEATVAPAAETAGSNLFLLMGPAGRPANDVRCGCLAFRPRPGGGLPDTGAVALRASDSQPARQDRGPKASGVFLVLRDRLGVGRGVVGVRGVARQGAAPVGQLGADEQVPQPPPGVRVALAAEALRERLGLGAPDPLANHQYIILRRGGHAHELRREREEREQPE